MTAEKFASVRTPSQRTRTMLLGRTALCGVLSIAVAAALAPRPAKAEPAGGAVVQGGASIQTTGSHTQINQSTQTAVINWQDFSIGSSESVTFAQPNTRSVALNKVTSHIPSDIQGQLTANGQVWILNPNGVYVGNGATINVGGLVASTAGLVEQDWEAGKYTLKGAPAGSEVNIAGSVTATDGSIVLVAPVVDVSGSLAARGDVALGAGSGFAVDFEGDGLTRFAVDEAAGARLNVSGTITAQGGAAYLVASATDAVEDAVVSIGGQVEATRIEERGGVVVISGGEAGVTEISGTVDTSQTEGAGGNVTITGGLVALTETAKVSADGATDGGTVQIGGAYQGGVLASDVVAHSGAPAESPLPTAKRTLVRAGAQISADAGVEGEGGTVIVWSDEITAFHGDLSATGGALGGDGGFAEVLGKELLDFQGFADLSAPEGAVGDLLLDPNNITIVGIGANDALLSGNAVLFAEPDTLTNVSISAAALNSAADITLQASGEIFVNSQIFHNLTGGLTFQAEDGIAINQTILSNGFLDFTGNVGGGGSITMAPGTALLGTDITLRGDTVTLNQVFASQGLQITAGDVNLLGGGVTATDGVTITSAGGIGFGATAVGGFQLTDAEGDLIGSNLTLDAAGTVTLDGISFANSLTAIGSDFNIASNITVSGAEGINFFRNDDGGANSTFGGAGGILSDTEIGRITADVLGYFDNDGAIDIQDTVTVTGFDTVTLGGTEIDIDNGDSLSVGTGVLVLQNTGNDGIDVGGNESGGSGSFVLSNDDVDRITAGTLGVKTTGGTVTFTDTPGGGGGGGVDPDFSGFDVLSVEATDVTIEAGVVVSVGAGAAGEFSVTHASPSGNITLGDAGGLSLSADELDRIGAATITANTTSGTIDVVEIEFTGANEPDTMNLNAPSGLVTFSDAGGGTELIEGLTEINISAADVNIDTTVTIDVGAGSFNLTNAEGDTITLGANDAAAGTFDLTGAEMDRIDTATMTAETAADIVLNGASADNAATLVLIAGTSIAVSGASSLDNDLVMNPGTAVSQTAALTVGGTTDINAAGLAVTLDNDGNDFGGAVDVEAATASLDDTTSIILGDIDVTTLTVEADNNITDIGATTAGAGVNVAGQTTLTAGGNIVLNDSVNDFAGAVGATGANITLRDANSIQLGNVTATTDLTVQADGAGTITQAAATAVTAGGTTDLIATGNVIMLDNTGNNFGEVDARGSDVTLRDSNAIVLDDVTVTGNLAVNAGGSITDADGTIDVQGTTNLTAFNGVNDWFDIVLDNGNHDFDSDGSGDGLTASAEDITLSESGNLILGSLTLHAADLAADPTVAGNTGSLSATATGDGDITQAAALTVPGAATFTATGNDVTLNSANDFVGALNVAADNVSLTDANSITLGDIDAAGNLTVTSTAGSIDDGVAGAAGSDVNVTGTTTLIANLGNITLNDGTNDFGGAVSASGLAVTLSDDNAIALADIDAASLSVDADDSIDDGSDGMVAGGEINVTGTSSFTAGTTVTLDDTVNDFGGAVSASGTTIVINDVNALTTGTITGSSVTLGTSGQLAVTGIVTSATTTVNDSSGLGFALGDSVWDPGTRISVTSAEANSFSGDVIFNTTADIRVGQLNFNDGLVQASTDLERSVTLNADASMRFDSGLNAAQPTSFEGDLIIDSNGTVDNIWGIVTVNGTTSITTDSAINLFNNHNFVGAVSASGTNIALADANSITLRDIDATGNLTVTAGTSILDSGATVLGEGIDVAGSTTLTAGAGSNVTVDDAVNTFGGVFNASGANIIVRDTGTLDLGDIDATAAFTAVSGGAITDGASAGAGLDVNVGGIATLDAVTTVTLDDLTNNFAGSVNARGTDISLGDADSITLADIDASGSLTVRAVTGAISDGNPGDDTWGGAASFDLTVGTTTSLTAATTVTANDANNSFGGAVSAAGTNIALVDANSLQLGVIDANGSLAATALNGTLTDTDGQKIDVQTTTSLFATGSIALDNTALHDFDSDATGDAITATGAGITIEDVNGMALTGLTSSNGIEVTGGGTGAVSLLSSTVSSGDIQVTSGGAATVSGVTATNGSIDIDSGGLASLTNSDAGSDITVNAGTTATLDLVEVGGSADITTGSDFVVVTNSDVDQDLLIDAGGTGVGLDEITVGGNLEIDSNGVLILGEIAVAGDLDAATQGSVTDIGTKSISVTGNATITAGGPGNYFDVVLDNPGTTAESGAIDLGGAEPGPGLHDFSALDVTGEDILIRDRNALTITASGNTDGVPDPTLNSNYDIDIDIGSSVHTATISPNGSVMIQAVGDISIDKVTAGQDALLTTQGNFIILPEDPVVAPDGNIPVHADDGDIWLVALNGGFKYWDPAGLDALYAGTSPGTSSLPGADNLIPAGTMFDAPQGNIAIIVNDAFKVLVTAGNTPITDPLAPLEPPDADPGTPGNQALDPATYDNNGLVLNTARDGLALISVKDGEIAIGSAPIIEGTLVEGGAFQALGALGALSSSFSDLFVATGNLALESRNTLKPFFPTDPAVSFIVENTASSIGAGAGTRVIGVTYVGGFWENIGVFGAFNGIQGQTAAGGGFLTNGVNSPAPGNGRDLQRSPEAITLLTGLVPFTINPNNTANGCIIGGGLCQPIGRVLLMLDVEDGSLLAFRFEDDEEEEDDQFSNRGDEEDWQ